jgi:hypothetical protein
MSGPGAGLTDNNLTLGNVTYTTALPPSLLALGKTGEAFSIAFLDISPVLNVAGGNLNAFTAVANGQFSSDLATTRGGGVPEPATWALMLIGVAGVGVCLRRRVRLEPSAA